MSLSVTVALSRQEFIAFSRYCHKNNYFLPKNRSLLTYTLLYLAFFAIMGGVFTLLQHFDIELNMGQFIVAVLMAILLYAIFAIRLFKTLNKAIPDADSSTFCTKTFTADENGLHIESAYGLWHYNWNSMRFIKQNGDTHYLFIDRTSAFIFPKRAFDSHENYLNFVQYLTQQNYFLNNPE
ncbi:YcxB family protein [Providencia sp. wls1943]|uniref:YcxB family protein n=1 Tax=unclassified Providencia TaxID=2633465 RepID=UPI0012B5985A|nr:MULTISPECIES: YcxB family protein [unclassified Providencia]MTB66101.1 YcxB family protein [Providencia sp. wls1943]